MFSDIREEDRLRHIKIVEEKLIEEIRTIDKKFHVIVHCTATNPGRIQKANM